MADRLDLDGVARRIVTVTGPVDGRADGATADGPPARAGRRTAGPAADGAPAHGPAADGPAADGPADAHGPAADGAAAGGPAAGGPAEALAVALRELAAVEEELRAAREELLRQRARLGDAAADRERKLLRAALGELPVPVFLLERDGIVRRANRAACELVDAPAAYPVGKPFAGFVSHRDRGALRYAVSAAAAGTSGSPVRGAVLAKGRPRDVVLRFAPLRLPGEVEPLVAVVAIAVGPGSALGAGKAAAALADLDAAPPEPAGDPAFGGGRVGTRRLDTMAAMTRLLLQPAASEDELLRRAADVLTADLADAVLVDLLDPAGDGPLTRRLATGAPAGARPTGDPVGRRTLPGRVTAGRRPQLVTRLEDPAEFGTTGTGTAGSGTTGSGTTGSGTTGSGTTGSGTTGSGTTGSGTAGNGAGGDGAGAVLGGTSAACAPLLPAGPDGPVLGAVTLVRRDGGAYDLADLGLLQQLCEHLALALHTDRAARRRTEVADALRGALLPLRLPEPAGLTIAAAFRPADAADGPAGPAVGGDFYDAVPAGDGWAVMLGDVGGRDVEAAAVTATVRHSLGVLASTRRRPEEVLARVNAYLRSLGGDRFATVVLARLTPRRGGWRVLLSGAGHPPALVVPADGPVASLPGGGRPLGLFDDAGTAATAADLRPGDTLLLHSDGVTAARSPGGRPFGDEGLATAAAAARDDVHLLVDAVRDAVVRHAGGRLRDDVALLAVRVEQAPPAARTG